MTPELLHYILTRLQPPSPPQAAGGLPDAGFRAPVTPVDTGVFPRPVAPTPVDTGVFPRPVAPTQTRTIADIGFRPEQPTRPLPDAGFRPEQAPRPFPDAGFRPEAAPVPQPLSATGAPAQAPVAQAHPFEQPPAAQPAQQYGQAPQNVPTFAPAVGLRENAGLPAATPRAAPAPRPVTQRPPGAPARSNRKRTPYPALTRALQP